MLLTLFPDIPPSRILLVYFDSFKDLKDREFWDNIVKYPDIEYASIVLKGTEEKKFVEVGTNPIELDFGYLFFVPDIIYKNGHFYSFRISAMVLDKEDPSKILYISKKPWLIPTKVYETSGSSYPTTDIAFPSSAIEYKDKILVYYGASDKYIAVAYIEKEKVEKIIKNESKEIRG